MKADTSRPPTSSGWSAKRTAPPPPPTSETIVLTTKSGVSLAVEVREPEKRAKATAILLHSTMVSRRIFGPSRDDGFAATLASEGLRTLALDFRGHGESGTPAARGGDWTLDDLVREDLPALCHAARQRWPNDKIALVGHSLGGQVATASVAAGHADADAIVVLATNLWLHGEDPNPLVHAKKSAVVRVWKALTSARGYFPARALGIGSDDESRKYVAGWIANWDRGHWRSDDGRIDYFDAMTRMRTPFLAVTSIGDTFICTPQGGFRFFQRVGSARSEFHLVRRADDGGAAPDHMGMVMRPSSRSIWHHTAKFCLG